jgi:transcriptional antiterminator RfaH
MAMTDAVFEKLSGDGTPPWFLAHLRPQAEAIARRNLERQGVRIFAPFEEVALRRRSKLIQSSRGLFPGYIFVQFDPELVRWRTVNSTMGVNRLVSFGGDRPAQVPQGLVSGLMDRCDPSGKLLPPRELRRGDLVRLNQGHFAEFVGTVEQIASDRRIWVLLDVLGKSTRVSVSAEHLRHS